MTINDNLFFFFQSRSPGASRKSSEVSFPGLPPGHTHHFSSLLIIILLNIMFIITMVIITKIISWFPFPDSPASSRKRTQSCTLAPVAQYAKWAFLLDYDLVQLAKWTLTDWFNMKPMLTPDSKWRFLVSSVGISATTATTWMRTMQTTWFTLNQAGAIETNKYSSYWKVWLLFLGFFFSQNKLWILFFPGWAAAAQARGKHRSQESNGQFFGWKKVIFPFY